MSDDLVKRLEHAAVAAHKRGDGWLDFWRDNAPSINRAAPTRRQYEKLTDQLLCLLVSGDTDGHVPIDPDAEPPWERDDGLGQVDDTHTAAKLQPGFLFDARPLYE